MRFAQTHLILRILVTVREYIHFAMQVKRQHFSFLTITVNLLEYEFVPNRVLGDVAVLEVVELGVVPALEQEVADCTGFA